MDNVTIKLNVEVCDNGEAVSASQTNVWSGLDYGQVLFIEKHLLGALSGINNEATALTAKMVQTNEPKKPGKR